MDIIARAAAAAVIGSILVLLLRRYTPELSLLLAVVTGAVIVWICAGIAAHVTEALRSVSEKGGIPSTYVSPVMKCIGIGLVTNLAAQICRDAQQGSIAAGVELCGTLCALAVSLPLIQAVLATVEKLL